MVSKVLYIASHLKTIFYHKYHKFNFVSALALLVSFSKIKYYASLRWRL